MTEVLIYPRPETRTLDKRTIPAVNLELEVLREKPVDKKYIELKVIGPKDYLAKRNPDKGPKIITMHRDQVNLLRASSKTEKEKSELQKQLDEANAKLRAAGLLEGEPAPTTAGVGIVYGRLSHDGSQDVNTPSIDGQPPEMASGTATTGIEPDSIKVGEDAPKMSAAGAKHKNKRELADYAHEHGVGVNAAVQTKEQMISALQEAGALS